MRNTNYDKAVEVLIAQDNSKRIPEYIEYPGRFNRSEKGANATNYHAFLYLVQCAKNEGVLVTWASAADFPSIDTACQKITNCQLDRLRIAVDTYAFDVEKYGDIVKQDSINAYPDY